ncbi:MAG: CpsD/CapB family tyrosine-protein kinase [Firmicutes bacterium]|nr:CpsD/CapB family tyrosine-protein kinase [Bacillota bacterium]
MPRPDTRRLVVHDDPKAVSSEAFRTLRTNLQFASPDAKLETILITSSVPAEGKSTVCSNLAVSIVQTGKDVILVDCDLRKPTVHKAFGLNNAVGLTSVLTGQVAVEDALQKTHCEGLSVLTAGPLPPNPTELLQSNVMQEVLKKLKLMGDQVLLDAPPVLPVADSMILSTYVDGVVLVIASRQVPREIALRAKELLQNTNARLLGVVLNQVRYSSDGDQYYYNYYTEEI